MSYRNSLLRDLKEADITGDEEAKEEIRADIQAIDDESQKARRC
ncbi:MAG: hypothetical protein ACREQ7_09375 [Candidatus Binatia bacterium]